MAKPRKDVKFQHRGSNPTTKPRRPSMSVSEHSEAVVSEPSSPTRNGHAAKIVEAVRPPSPAPTRPGAAFRALLRPSQQLRYMVWNLRVQEASANMP